MSERKDRTKTEALGQLAGRYGDSILLAICSAVAVLLALAWGSGHLDPANPFTPPPSTLALWILFWICLWYSWSRVIERYARWPLAVSALWAALTMSACLISLLYKPLCFSRGVFLFLSCLSGAAFLIMTAWPFFRRSKPPDEEKLRKAAGRLVDFGAVPLLLMVLLLDPLYFAYLPWPEAEKLFLYEGYRFFGEIGQFLAWANEVYHGAWQGRDFFCLYGPLYIYSIVAMWKLAGKSVQALGAYWQIMSVLSLIALYAFFRQYWRGRLLCVLAALALVFVSVLEYPLSSCRFTAAIAAFALLAGHGRGVRWLLASAGALVALAVSTSQEVGLATLAGAVIFLVCNSLGMSLSTVGRKIATFVFGLLVVLMPLALVFAAHDALWPMVRNVIEYPQAVALGYGNYPFPRADSVIPLNLTGAPLSALLVRAGAPSTMLFYYGPAVYALCAAYLAVRLVVDRWRLDAFDSMVAALVASGIMMFGVALGRSDNAHLIFALPPAFCLHLLFVGRSGSILRENMTECRVRKFRYAEFLICTAFLVASLAFFNPALLARKTAERAKDSVEKMLYALKLPGPPLKVYGPAFMEVVGHVRSRTGPEDYVLALPSNSAYYYLTDRRNPTRFCQFAMLATDRHRLEVLEDIRRRRPKYVIYDIIGERVDEISDEVQFPGALDFILRNCAGEERIGDTLILLDGGFIPGWGPSETPLLEWDLSRPEIPARLDLKGARVLGRGSLGLHLSLEIPEAELSINGLALDSGDFYLLRLSARIDKGNVGKIAWTVNRGGGQKTYSKMLAVNMKGEWKEYRMLIATREPPGLIESITLIPSDEPTEISIRSITLTRLNHLTPRE